MRIADDRDLAADLYTSLVCADSVTSLIAHRHSGDLPADLRDDLLACSAKYRALAEEIKPRPGMAVYVCYSGEKVSASGDKRA